MNRSGGPGRRRRPADRPVGCISCEHVRESVSALLDGEPPPLPAAVTDAHLAGCVGCRRFRDAVATLSAVPAVRPARPVPGHLREELAGALAPAHPKTARRWATAAGRPGYRRLAGRGARPARWQRATRWAAATAPVAALSVALPLGAWNQPRLMPSHARTPCTAALAHASRSRHDPGQSDPGQSDPGHQRS